MTGSIADGVRHWAATTPDAPAVLDGERRLTYRQLDERASRLARVLRQAGCAPGDTVAVLLGNRLEYCEVAAGIAKAGLWAVPLNPRLSPPEAAYIMGHAGCRALVLDDAVAHVVQPCAQGLAVVLSLDGTTLGDSYDDALTAVPAEDPLLPVDPDSPFCVAYTSGTTGRPKGVVISHRSRVLTFAMSAREWDLGVGRCSVAVAPMYHGAGFAFGYAPVHTGGTVTMLRAWDPEAFLAVVERDRAQSAFLVPTHAQTLRARGADLLARYDVSSLDTLFFNAAALPSALKAWVQGAFPGAGVHELYGSTESGIVTNLRPADAARKPGSVGPAWYATEVRIVDDAGEACAPGVPGELFSRSPYLMDGYLHDPEATAACTTADGFVTCGDIAYCDDEGYVRIVDRKKDVVISGGVNVYPREVEEAALTHPAVADVAVVGVPDDVWGERVAAVVVAAEGAAVTCEELDTYLRPVLAGYKIPRRLLVVERLPRNAAGKVLKRELRDLFR